MGVVYAAHHLELNTRVAIKVLQPKLAGDPIARARFLREARLAASIGGDHSTRIFDVGADDAGTPYMVMEYLAGESLDRRLEREGRLPLGDVATIMMQLLGVLAEAHAGGLVHRDLKPANLFLTERVGENIWVKVMDFGISKYTGPVGVDPAPKEPSLSLTEPRTLLGSPEYMSPEQLRDSANVNARADIWACGVVIFELLSGKVPFEGQTLADLCAQIISSEPKSLGTVCPVALPAPIVELVAQCLQKEANARPSSAYEIAAVLAPYASESARALLPGIRARAAERSETATPSMRPPRSEAGPGGESSPTEPQPLAVETGSVSAPQRRSGRRRTWIGISLVVLTSAVAYRISARPGPLRTEPSANAADRIVPALERIGGPPTPGSLGTSSLSAPQPSSGGTARPPVPVPRATVPGASAASSGNAAKVKPGRIQNIDGIELIP